MEAQRNGTYRVRDPDNWAKLLSSLIASTDTERTLHVEAVPLDELSLRRLGSGAIPFDLKVQSVDFGGHVAIARGEDYMARIDEDDEGMNITIVS